MLAEKTFAGWSRAIAVLGLAALSLTDELNPVVLILAWSAWGASWILDRFPAHQAALRRFDAWAVGVLVAASLTDFFFLRSSIFVTVAHFLLLFQTYKLIGRKNRIDSLQIMLFSFFQVLSATTLSADILQAMILLVWVPLSAAGLFWHQAAVCEEKGSRLNASTHRIFSRLAWKMAGISLPVTFMLTAGVFIFFPRLKWNVTIPGFGNARIGYSEEMNLSRTGLLSADNKVALWMAFAEGSDRDLWDGYLRGATFTDFDGRQWHTDPSGALTLRADSNNLMTLVYRKERLRHTRRASITLMDTGARTLVTPGAAIQVRTALSSLQRWKDGSLHFGQAWEKPLLYEVWSAEESSVEDDVAQADWTSYLKVPRLSSQVQTLANQAAGNGPALTQAQRLETYFRTTYRYSTDLGGESAEHPVETFLFNRKRGPCGHFATAMALCLRLRGIPSRVVAGYWQGEWNVPAKQQVIRSRDAHAWVEAFIPGQGWRRFDPSPRERENGTDSNVWSHTWLMAKQRWDYLSLQWNKIILEYDMYSQLRTLEHLKTQSFGWSLVGKEDKRIQPTRRHSPRRSLPAFRVVFYFTGALFLTGIFYWACKPHTPEAAYLRFLKRMSKMGVPKTPSETALEFARRAQLARPTNKAFIRKATQQYVENRFCPSPR